MNTHAHMNTHAYGKSIIPGVVTDVCVAAPRRISGKNREEILIPVLPIETVGQVLLVQNNFILNFAYCLKVVLVSP